MINALFCWTPKLLSTLGLSKPHHTGNCTPLGQAGERLTHDRIVPTVSAMTDQYKFRALGL